MIAGMRRVWASSECPACGVTVALATISSGKQRKYHKCPHGRVCVSVGSMGNQGWNPGGAAHKVKCGECWSAYTKARKEGLL